MAEKLPYTLAQLAETLAEQRDEHQALFDEHGDCTDRGYVSAFKLALSFLHTHTNGDFGQPLEEQPGGTR